MGIFLSIIYYFSPWASHHTTRISMTLSIHLFMDMKNCLVKYKRCSTSKSTPFMLELSGRLGMGQGTDLELPEITAHKYYNYLQNKPSKLLQTILKASEVLNESVIGVTDLLQVIFNPGSSSGHTLTWEFCPMKLKSLKCRYSVICNKALRSLM